MPRFTEMHLEDVMMDGVLADYLERVIDPFINPQKRIFLGYLVTAIGIAVVAQMIVSRTRLRDAVSEFFARRIWFSSSAIADYKILLVNHALMMGIIPRLASKLVVATIIFEALHVWLDGRVFLWPSAPAWAIAGAFTVTLFLLDDLSKYLVHRALHRWSVLWAFHKVHHSAEVLTPLTVYRTHPVEGVIFALRSVLVQALAIAVFLFFFGDRTSLVTILGANAFLFFFNVAGSNLRHSHVWISYGKTLEHWLISPAQHQIHHSVEKEHHDRNFGAVLAIWDRIGGSLYLAGNANKVRFGDESGVSTDHRLTSLYVSPMIEAAHCLTRPIARGFSKMRATKMSAVARWSLLVAVTAGAAWAAAPHAALAAELNIYSHRQPFLIKPFLEAYTAKTGTKINVVYASKGLAQRLQAEGARSPADVVLTVDIARLWVYADKDLLASVESSVLAKNIPAHLRDSENRWFAFSKRARIIVASRAAKDAATIKSYSELADPKWRGRICSRPGSHVYNRALVASVINAKGVDGAEKWAKGLMANLARRPQGNDRAQVKAIYEGVCDLAIINNYYFGKLKFSEKPAQRKWAQSVQLIFPDQDGRGAHVNISGGGVAKHSKNKAEAIRFLEFLTTKTAQDLYGSINFEYPVNPATPLSKELESWGQFKEDTMPIARIAELAPEAQKVIDRAGW